MIDIFGLKEKRIKKENEEASKSGILIGEMPSPDRKGFGLKCILLNGTVNGIIVISSLAGVLEAFDVKYSRFAFFAAILAIAYFIAGFYVKTVWKVLGYIAVISAFIYGIMEYRNVLRGGFGTIANAFMEVIEFELDLPIERRYSEFTRNKVFAVTFCAIFIGGALALLFNIVISETKGFMLVLMITFPLIQLGMYFDRDMNIPVFLLYAAGITALMVLRASPYYRHETKRKKGYRMSRKKDTCIYDYVTDTGNGFSRMVVVVAVIFASAFIISLVMPEKSVGMEKYSEWKEGTKETAKKVALVGFWGMLNPNGRGNGGIGRSKLGQADHVNLDYQKDLDVLTMVLPNEKNIYLRAYTGTVYDDNNWKYVSEKSPEGYRSLSDYYLSAEDIASLNYNILQKDSDGLLTEYLKVLKVYNTFANDMFMYLPANTGNMEKYFDNMSREDEWDGGLQYGSGIRCSYYTLKDMNIGELERLALQVKNKSKSYDDIYDTEEKYREYVYNTYLSVPDENRKVIENIFKENNITNDDGIDSIYKVISFLEENYEYTLIPGRTPANKDFVNYFLQDSKKGYCTYFASSAVLMFRSLGIPARYAGGYMVSTTDEDYMHEVNSREYDDIKVISGDVQDGDYKLYDIEVNDSHAHAWTEVYVDNLGWVTVEATPPSDEEDTEEEDTGGIGQILADMFFNSRTAEAVKNTTISTLIILASIILLAVAVLIIVINILRYRRKKRTDIEKNFRYLEKVVKAAEINWDNNMVFSNLSDELIKCGLCSNDDAVNLIKILEKDRYSKKDTDDKDRLEVNRIVMEVSENVYERLSIIKRLKYRYLF